MYALMPEVVFAFYVLTAHSSELIVSAADLCSSGSGSGTACSASSGQFSFCPTLPANAACYAGGECSVDSMQ